MSASDGVDQAVEALDGNRALAPGVARRKLWGGLVCALMVVVLLGPAPAGAAAGTTIVSLTFDDGSADQYVARSMLASRGMKGTFYANSGKVGSSSYYMTWDQLRAIASDGNEIGGHTINHVHLPQLTNEEQRRQICDDRQALLSAGFQVTSFAYPYGEYDATSKALSRECGYTSARRVGGIRSDTCCSDWVFAEPIPPLDAFAIRTPLSIRSTTSLSTMQSYVLQAEQNGGGWVPLVIHQICDGCSSYAITQEQLASFMDWLRPRSSTGTLVKTVDQVIDGTASPPPPPPDTVPPPSDTMPPAVSITSPADGSAVRRKVNVTASATDEGSGVNEVRFYVDGASIGTDATAPYGVTWNTRTSGRGNRTLTAVAVDRAGNSTTSAPVTVQVK